jgi:hypothetical protein
MNSNTDNKEKFLISEYEFLQKVFEIQFNHFMGVFYFWVALITAPLTAGLLSDPSLSTVLGVLFISVASLGFFLSAKMFDIRKSQLRYAQKMNEIRTFFWHKYKIEEKHQLLPLGKNANLARISTTDFGMYMALIMSIVHGGLFLFSSRIFSINFAVSLLIGLSVSLINFGLYFLFMRTLK